MPHLPPVASAVVTILGVVVAVTRLLTASRPFWSTFPAWLQKGLPAALVALGLLPTALEHATSWLDVAEALVLAISAWFTASRGDKRPPVDKDGGPRIDRTNSDPKLTREELSRVDNEAPLALVALVCLMLVGCDPRRPPCDESKLRAADERYVERVLTVCLPKYPNKESCPEWPALKAEHSRELKEICP